jgi:outer membrane protein OmpA-like peptidoglycan-associated protein
MVTEVVTSHVRIRVASLLLLMALLTGCHGTLSQVVAEKIELEEKIMFAPNSASIDQSSTLLLGRIADYIRANPQFTKIRIEGHTDLQGTAQENLKLSRERATAVLEALVARGIARSRLIAEGYGSSRPLCSKKTVTCDSLNRRTELIVVEIVKVRRAAR